MSSTTGSRHNCEQGQGYSPPQQRNHRGGGERHHHRPHPTGGAEGIPWGGGGRGGVAALRMYVVTPTPMNYRPSFCIVNTVSNRLFWQVRILYLSQTIKTKPTFQQSVPDNWFRFDVSTHSTATLCSSNQKPSVAKSKNQRNMSWKTIQPNSQKIVFCFPRKKLVSLKRPTYSHEKDCLDRKTYSFLGK